MQPIQQAAVRLQNEGSCLPDSVRASFVFGGVQEEIKGKGNAPHNMQPTQQAAVYPQKRLDRFSISDVFSAACYPQGVVPAPRSAPCADAA